jgi:hypothetical protein
MYPYKIKRPLAVYEEDTIAPHLSEYKYPAGIGTDTLKPVAGFHWAQSLHLS